MYEILESGEILRAISLWKYVKIATLNTSQLQEYMVNDDGDVDSQIGGG